MKNLYLLLICAMLHPVCLFAQSVNDNWYFGSKAGLNFSTSPPTVLLDSDMDTWEAVGVASDYNGGLLFYTDGVSIWNREHDIMPNGTGLTGDASTQQTYIVHHPNNSSLLYVFTLPVGASFPKKIAYTIVNMNLGGIGSNGKPLGDVDTNFKNIDILDEHGFPLVHTTEAITGTMHGDNQSYWILIPNGSKLYSYKVDANGFNNTPETSTLTSSFPSTFEYNGQIKISPNLPDNLGLPYTNFVAISLWNPPYSAGVQSFNNNTGRLTTDFDLELSAPLSGFDSWNMEFTSNGLLLYAGRSSDNKVFVFDLLNNLSKDIFSTSKSLGNIQRAVNNEIYLSYSNHDFISKIINPNSYATSGVDLNNIYLSGRTCRIGLPQHIPPSIWGEICYDAYSFNSPELKNYFIYQTIFFIETYQNYMVDINQNIILSAGTYVEMLPNTYLKAGSTVLAMIEGCDPPDNKKNLTFKTKKNYIDLDGAEEKHLKVYPNPVKDRLNIQTKEIVTNVKIYDFSGTLLFQTTPGTTSPIINMNNFKSGIYFVEITQGNTTEIVRVIK